ncbi:MoxR-like ATPase [Clostridium punense]|uniref:MoxR-like ATPase n=1 Tax=Clostridium punense TaxID=1054297 RepID=A0ABS4JZP2_9CLOT|nr:MULTISPECIES: ATP-binding protein [Clostridium]EQB87017.1 hypothetical protein M918_11065 [Clostridium sp. BL8]MBP2020988.1 MoxR-like ATPase [Clostridium punense]
MNFNDTLVSAELIIETKDVPLIVGESGIGKTALAKELAKKHEWSLVVIDGNLLKEGEIGGLPTIEDYTVKNAEGILINKKRTVYAVHTKLQEIEELIKKEKEVLLFIDEINRCEHTVQQELMNLILNREINGYELSPRVKILAAMNPSSKYGDDFDYQVVDMDSAQENRFVWLYMDSDVKTWLQWAVESGLEEKVIEFIATFPEYLHSTEKGTNTKATPRSYERVSKVFKLYMENENNIPKRILLNIVAGNVGNKIAQEFISFIDSNNKPLIAFEEVFSNEEISKELELRIKEESHTRLYLTAKNLLHILEKESLIEVYIERLIDFLKLYPIDLRLALMQDMKLSYNNVYNLSLEKEEFINMYFAAYDEIKG